MTLQPTGHQPTGHQPIAETRTAPTNEFLETPESKHVPESGIWRLYQAYLTDAY